MSANSSHLIVVCSNFPYGYGEPFLEVELEYLVHRFDKVTICQTEKNQTQKVFEIPDGIELVSFEAKVNWLQKLFGMWRLLFDAEMRDEISVINSQYHSLLTMGKIKTMVSSKLRAQKIKRAVESLIGLGIESDTYVYSYWTDDSALALAYLKKERSDLTVFSRLHGWDLYFERSSYHYLPFRKTIFNGLDAVFTISENGKNYLLSHFDTIISKGRVLQSRLGIRTVNKLEKYSRTFRRFKVVSCSNIIPIKRVGLIVEALSHIEELEIDWVHFGSGAEDAEIESLAAKLLGPKQNVEYHFPGRVPNWEVLNYYSEHMVDLFISLSKYDGIPVSIMEAMSFGIPAIATDVGGVSEIVINGKTGFLLDQEIEPEYVAEVIENVANMEASTYDAMRKEARNIWGAFYSADINYPDFCDKILSLKQA